MAAAMHSDDVIWQVVKKHNAFVRKSVNGTVLSAEPFNLYNLHNKRFSGLANSTGIDVRPGNGKETKLGIKRKGKQNQPKKAVAAHTVKAHNKRQRKAIVDAACKVRPDLTDAAARRACAVHKATRNKAAALKAAEE